MVAGAAETTGAAVVAAAGVAVMALVGVTGPGVNDGVGELSDCRE